MKQYNDEETKKNQIIESLQHQMTFLQTENEQLKNKLSLLEEQDDVFKLREIINRMPGHVYWKNKNGQCLGCNNSMAKFLGFSSPDDIVGKRSQDLLPSYNDALHLDKIDQEVMDTQKEIHIEETGTDTNNELRVFASEKTPLFNRKREVIGLVGVSLNITAQKKLEQKLIQAKEEAEKANQAKTQFLGIVNHELRTPVSGIIGLIDFLKQDDLSMSEKKEIIAILENGSQHLLLLINDLLDFSQLDTGHSSVRLLPTSLHDLTQEIISLLKTLAEGKGLSLRIQIDPDIPAAILTDTRLLKQILINLVGNAIKFTQKGHVVLQVKQMKRWDQKTRLEFKIMDTGCGIPSDKLDIIFQPFKQLENLYVRQSSRSGTGLGLSIVKKLAELIGVHVHVSSELGKGSTFTLSGDFSLTLDGEVSHDQISHFFRVKELPA